MTSTPERTGAAGGRPRGYPLAAAAARDYWRTSGLDGDLRALSARLPGLRARRRAEPLRLQAELNRALLELDRAEGRLEACLREVGALAERGADADDAALRRLAAVCRLTALLVGEQPESETVLLERVARLLAEEFGARVRVFLADAPPEQAGTARAALHEAVTVRGPYEDGTGPGGVREARARAGAAMRAARGVQETGAAALCRSDPAGALLAVPLGDGPLDGPPPGPPLGSLVLLRSEDFVLHELGLLQELGRQLALALRSERCRRRESTAAQLLQSSLLPSALPDVPGVQLAARYRAPRGGAAVGGDFYDVFPVLDGWGLLLGDVCGKGEEAAAVTAAVRHGTRALGAWERCPGTVLERVGRAMALQDTTERFATAVLARLRPGPADRPGSVELTVASAGHLPAVVVRARGEVAFLRGGGCPLGIAGLSEVAREEVVLDAGDALLLYSDGVTEARDRDGAFFDERGLAAVLAETAGMSAEALVRTVEQRVLSFAGGPPQDDMALLAVRVLTAVDRTP